MKSQKKKLKNDIIHDYDSVLRESSVLTSVSGIVFEFLLNISLNSPDGFSTEYANGIMYTISVKAEANLSVREELKVINKF
ncbi:MAG: hypothetical protein ACXWFC_12760 [Nitrososphaeraceae archaeon]